jgi:chromosomal replication initiator protein
LWKGHDRTEIKSMRTFASWVSVSENRAARAAVEGVADAVRAGRPRPSVNPLFLHGPTGTGKTHLVAALIADVTRRSPNLVAAVLDAGDFEAPNRAAEVAADIQAARRADLVVVEDLQHLSARAAETFAPFVDRCRSREQQLVLTAVSGPAQLTHLPARLTSRLASGLVVGLQPLGPASRLALLESLAQNRNLSVGQPVLAWLAEHVAGSGRQLEGAVTRLEGLARLNGRAPDVDTLAAHFRDEADARTPTVERIVQRVGRYFQVEPRQMQSRCRSRQALLPRQVGMYLARRLTKLSLQQIGAYFGGRDHSTVLHACRKVEQTLARDVTLSGAVRQLHADLA